jgi:hypothetical protein
MMLLTLGRWDLYDLADFGRWDLYDIADRGTCSRHGFLHQRMNTNGTGTK